MVLDGVFASTPAGGVVFHPATGIDGPAIATVQAEVRQRLLQSFVRRGLLEGGDARAMQAWAHGGGFSVNAAVRIEATDRPGLQRLLRYCALPPFALERLQQRDAGKERKFNPASQVFRAWRCRSSGERAPKTDCLRGAEAAFRADRAGNTALPGRLRAVGRGGRESFPRRAMAARAES